MRGHFPRLILTWTLAIATALAPSFSYARAESHVTPDLVLKLQSGEYQRSLDIGRYVNSMELAKKSASLMATGFKGVGHIVFNDVFQTAIIMYASAAAQLTKSRMEQNQLLAGYKPTEDEVQKAAVSAAEEVLCGSTPGTATVSKDILCSGEFWMGTGGAIAARTAVQITVMQVIKILLKENPTRAAVINLVGTFAASFLMLSGFVMSAQLWTEGVHLLNDPVKEDKARNLFGRAVTQWVSGNSAAFAQTEDGQLAAQVRQNMENILLLEPQERADWFHNAWRFGMARGEMVVNLTILMTALEAGGVVGGAAAAFVGLTGWPAVAATFVIATGFGFGISYAEVYFPDLTVGSHLTTLMQNSRAWLDARAHASAQYQIDLISQKFGVDMWTSGDVRYKKIWEKRMALYLPELRKYRQSETAVGFEKYYELRKKVDEADAMVKKVTEVISHSELRDKITLNENGEFMSVAQAKEKFCPSATGSKCDFPLELQLKKLETAKAQIADGEALLTQMATYIVQTYDSDSKLLHGLMDKVTLQFPADLAEQMKSEANMVDDTHDLLALDFASLHEPIRVQNNLNFQSPEEQNSVSLAARGFVAKAYVHGIDDAEQSKEVEKLLAQGQ